MSTTTLIVGHETVQITPALPRHGRWQATIVGAPSQWVSADTQAEALGGLILQFPDEFRESAEDEDDEEIPGAAAQLARIADVLEDAAKIGGSLHALTRIADALDSGVVCVRDADRI